MDCFLAEQHRSNGNYKTRYILHSQREYKVRYMARSILCVDAEKPPPVRAAAWIKLRKCKSNGGWNVQQSHNLFLCFIFLFRYEIYKGLGIIFILV